MPRQNVSLSLAGLGALSKVDQRARMRPTAWPPNQNSARHLPRHAICSPLSWFRHTQYIVSRDETTPNDCLI